MATAIASAQITIFNVIDISEVTRYYILKSSTASAPSKPTTNPPASDWTTTEPSYTTGSTNTLYFVDLTVFSDDSFNYSEVSKSSSYEAAKEAYNKATNAQDSVDNLESEVYANMGVLEDKIVMIVSDENGNTLLTQTGSGWTFDLSSLKSEIDNNASSITDLSTSMNESKNKTDESIYALLTSIDNIDETVDEISKTANGHTGSLDNLDERIKKVETKTEHISVTTVEDVLEDGTVNEIPCLLLFEDDYTEFKSAFTNKYLKFIYAIKKADGSLTETVPTRVTTHGVETENITINKDLNHVGFRWRKRSNGNYGLSWIGGTE